MSEVLMPGSGPAGAASSTVGPGRSWYRWRPSRRQVWVTVLVAMCLGALGAGWLAIRGAQSHEHLRRAGSLAQQLRQQVQDGNPAAAATLAELQRETRAARSDTEDPTWGLGAHLPIVGDDLAAVRTIAIALDDLAHQGLPPLVEVAGSLTLEALTPTGAQFDLVPLRTAAPKLAVADAAVRQARDQITVIAPDGLVDPLRSALLELRDSLDRTVGMTSTAARAGALLPPMLGVDGPRNYLVLFQNLAEVRATGGMPGAYVVINVDRGRVRVVHQGTAVGLGTYASPVLPLDPALRSLYSDRIGKLPADINFSPDFPTAAKLAREMYRRHSGLTVDGVLATDPVALSYLLTAIGPVAVPDGVALDADNAVRVLLSETYTMGLSANEQDRYFAAAARATFEALTRRPLNPAATMAQLARAAGERRILLWSAHPAEERAITGTVLAGALPARDGNRPTVGVFLNDGSGAKLGYYLTHSAELAVTGDCRPDGRRQLTLRVSLGSTSPRSGLSPDVLGLGLAGDPYTVRTNVSIYSSTGGTIVDVKLDGAAAPVGAGFDGRRAVGIITVDLKPGVTRTVDVTLLTGIPATGWGATVTPALHTTPGITGWQSSVHSATGCRTEQ